MMVKVVITTMVGRKYWWLCGGGDDGGDGRLRAASHDGGVQAAWRSEEWAAACTDVQRSTAYRNRTRTTGRPLTAAALTLFSIRLCQIFIKVKATSLLYRSPCPSCPSYTLLSLSLARRRTD